MNATTPYDRTADRIAQLAQQVLAGQPLTRDQAEELTHVAGEALYDLFFWANKIRIRHVGPQVKFCSIVAAKVGACSEDCGFCSQSAHFKTGVKPSKLTVEQMLEAADQAVANGADSFGIVNSGRGPTERELDWLEDFYKETVAQGKIRPCATLGELTPDQAQRLKAMGVQRINHNLETSKRHFPNICSTHTYDDRVRTIETAKAAGLSICSGGIFGMGEVWDDRLEMAFALRDLVPLNFLNRIEGTPLYEKVADLTPMQALHIIALFRFILPDRELKVAGGREVILRDLQSWIFFAGASSFLIGNYLTTFGRSPQDDHQMLRDLEAPFIMFDEAEHEVPAETHTGPASLGMSLPVVQ